MDKETKTYATYAVLILIVVVYFAIENRLALFIALGALFVLGLVIDGTRTKD